jgi:two-component system sensor histidine kinase TctE
VHLRRDANTAALTLSDSGPGIAPALGERLFQPFATDHRASPSLSGSGLGLAICREIVQSLGGQIELDNRLEGGSVRGLDATVRLPISTP